MPHVLRTCKFDASQWKGVLERTHAACLQEVFVEL